MQGNERVSVREGVLPIVLVSPHGYDDPLTDLIAEVAADKLDCYAVMNHGWERAADVNENADKANCNSIAHIHEDVVKDEFLDPLLRYMHRCTKTIYAAGTFGGKPLTPFLNKALMITLHGAGNEIRTQTKDNKLDFILGTGLGDPMRITCPQWKKNAIAWHLINKGVHVWEGKSGGTYAAWGKDNLNQLFVHKYPRLGDSIQIEIVRSPWRETPARASATGSILADVIRELISLPNLDNFDTDLGMAKC